MAKYCIATLSAQQRCMETIDATSRQRPISSEALCMIPKVLCSEGEGRCGLNSDSLRFNNLESNLHVCLRVAFIVPSLSGSLVFFHHFLPS